MNRYDYDSLSTGCRVNRVYKYKVYFIQQLLEGVAVCILLDRVLLIQSNIFKASVYFDDDIDDVWISGVL